MTIFPTNIAKYISSVRESDVVVCLHIDEYDNLVSWEGNLAYLGISDLIIDQSVSEQLGFLEGMLPAIDTIILRFISFNEGYYTHVHIVSCGNSTYVLLFDAISEYEKQQEMQQQINDLKLLTVYKDQLLRALEEKTNTVKQVDRLKSPFIIKKLQSLATACKKKFY
ncbi:hypothetical protein QUF74_09835 [Candidatus Halobeggiatoa sp. HSG11]|nr:hypothetical protein [Candidatus Halobeggiatoa sp. HSG11]